MTINSFKKGDNLHTYITVDDVDILNVTNHIVMYILI